MTTPQETTPQPYVPSGAGQAAAITGTSAVPAGQARQVLTQASAQTLESAAEALKKMLALLRVRSERRMRQVMAGAPPADIAAAIAEESDREWHFQANADQRFRLAVSAALREPTKQLRAEKLQKAIDAEKRYAKMRADAIDQRAKAALERVSLRRGSPQGVLWQLGKAKEHTPDCVAMHGWVWPWQALDRFRFWPPVHGGCQCELKGYKQALAAGTPMKLQDVESAIRRLSIISTMREDEQSLLPYAEALEESGLVSVERFGLLLRAQLEGVA